MKNIAITFLIIILGSLFTYAQETICVLEAEDAELVLPAKVKYVDGYSGNAYVGDNDPGSSITFREVEIAEEGTYEFRTYYTSMHIRSIAIKVGNYPKVACTSPIETEDWNAPPVAEMVTYIYLDKGKNTIVITPHNGGAPNIDKFEIRTTPISMPQPEYVRSSYEYDLTDDAVITTSGTAENLDYITDNDEYTVYSYDGSFVEITMQLETPHLLTGYYLSSGPGSSQNVKDWKLEYSTNGDTYSQLTPDQTEEVENGTFFIINRVPHADKEQSAGYYRLAASGGAIGEVQLFGIPYLSNTDNKNFPADLTRNIDILSNVLGDPVGVYEEGSFDERCYNLIDRDMSKKYYWYSASVFHVEVELKNPAELEYYTLTSCQDYPERDPKSWVVEGFDNDWEVVSKVTDFQFPTRYATMKFYTTTNKEYQGYRLRTLENNGADSFQLLKWQLFNSTGTSINMINSDNSNIYSSENQIVIHSKGYSKYWITNLSGQLISTGALTPDEKAIPVEKGIYIVKVLSDRENTIQKVLVK